MFLKCLTLLLTTYKVPTHQQNFILDFITQKLILHNASMGGTRKSWDSKLSYFITSHIASLCWINLTLSSHLFRLFIGRMQRYFSYNCRVQFIIPHHWIRETDRRNITKGLLSNASVIGEEWHGGMVGNMRTPWYSLRYGRRSRFISNLSETGFPILLPNIIILIAGDSGGPIMEEISNTGLKLFMITDTDRPFNGYGAHFTVMNTKSESSVLFYLKIMSNFIRYQLLQAKATFRSKRNRRSKIMKIWAAYDSPAVWKSVRRRSRQGVQKKLLSIPLASDRLGTMTINKNNRVKPRRYIKKIRSLYTILKPIRRATHRAPFPKSVIKKFRAPRPAWNRISRKKNTPLTKKRRIKAVRRRVRTAYVPYVPSTTRTSFKSFTKPGKFLMKKIS